MLAETPWTQTMTAMFPKIENNLVEENTGTEVDQYITEPFRKKKPDWKCKSIPQQ